MERVLNLASQSPVVIFTLNACCMCHAVKRLFLELGATPAIYELDHDNHRGNMEMALVKLLGRQPPVPTVFIGGMLIGTTDTVLTLHLGGRLLPLLRDAGALRA